MVHSHDYSPWEWLRRSFDEARAVPRCTAWSLGRPGRRADRNLRGNVAATGAGPARTATVGRALRPFGAASRRAAVGAVLGAPAIACGGTLTARLSLERRRSDREMLDSNAESERDWAPVLGYSLVHANSSRRRRAAAGGGRALGEQDVHRPRGAGAHAQGAGAPSSASDPPQQLQGAGQRLRRGAARASSSGSPGATAAARAPC